MSEVKRSLDNLFVATPCSADWDDMAGDDQVRFCKHCQLNVYNISEMTRAQGEKLIAASEGRICTKFYRRADGTIMTKDCPTAIRSIKRKVSRLASATLSAVIGIVSGHSNVMADGHQNCKHYVARVIRLTNQEKVFIAGKVKDVTGAVIEGAKIEIIDEKAVNKYISNTGSDGKYKVELPRGVYKIRVEMRGFSSFTHKGMDLQNGDSLQLDIEMQVGSMGGGDFVPEKTEDRVIKHPLNKQRV